MEVIVVVNQVVFSREKTGPSSSSPSKKVTMIVHCSPVQRKSWCKLLVQLPFLLWMVLIVVNFFIALIGELLLFSASLSLLPVSIGSLSIGFVVFSLFSFSPLLFF